MSSAGGADDSPSFQFSDIAHILGQQVSELIRSIAQQANERGLTLFLAGGVVRDLWLSQRNLDLDFVVEGDAIGFAGSLASLYGGSIQVHASFGTAKWTLDEAAAASLSFALDQVPAHLDFAAARSETYAYPTALPTVSPSDIDRDLLRRDFTVNALALQLSPSRRGGHLIDVSGGVNDLKRKLIRVLHDRSFIDDPTRILRALRYSRRLGFEVEPHTAKRMREALPFLGRITGQRLRNEIDLILREAEAGEIMLRLQELGALKHIHPAFSVSSQLPVLITLSKDKRPPWKRDEADRQTLRWNLALTGIGRTDVQGLCERLALTKALTQSITGSAKLMARFGPLEDRAIRPSQVTRLLDEFPDIALQVGWLLAADKPQVKANLSAYASDWRHRGSTISGDDLKAMGIAPGPLYRRILDQLRFAWIDGDIRSVEDEHALLQQLLAAED